MKIAHLEAVGFRGIKTKLRVNFGAGFTVICGRNGSGKSTILDAVDFAISGKIRKYGARKENNESAADYVWWRGAGLPADVYVEIGLVDDDGTEIKIIRDRNGLRGISESQVAETICDLATSPPNSIDHLCRTSIIRDELIAELSLDLPETERFALVQSSVAVTDVSALDATLVALEKELQTKLNASQAEYQASRNALLGTMQELSERKARIASEQEAATAASNLRRTINIETSDYRALIKQAREFATERRNFVGSIEHLIEESIILIGIDRSMRRSVVTERLAEIVGEVTNVERRLASVDQALKDLAKSIVEAQNERPRITAYTYLLRGGSSLGLQDGICPLCASEVSPEKFELHLGEIQQRLDQHEAGLSRQLAQREELEVERSSLIEQFDGITQERAELEHRLTSLEERRNRWVRESKQYNLDTDHVEEGLERLKSMAAVESGTIAVVEQNANLLQSSFSYGQIEKVENTVGQSRKTLEHIEQNIRKIEKALVKVKETRRILKRVAGELVDERLAALSPLLAELYGRLKPHTDWGTLAYHIRGDVRRFLSLRVGDDLNPSFMFSSGQRRTAGLAFLLAVYLSRPWVRLHSIFLDDPVQHVDDFRALHLAEVLSAIRRRDEQVICTVEDPALAELLARKLRSVEHGDGVRVNLEYSPGEGVKVHEARIVPPMPRQVMLSA